MAYQIKQISNKKNKGGGNGSRTAIGTFIHSPGQVSDYPFFSFIYAFFFVGFGLGRQNTTRPLSTTVSRRLETGIDVCLLVIHSTALVYLGYPNPT